MRCLASRAWSWDDSFIIFSWMCSVAVTTCVGISTMYGLGTMLHAIPITLRSYINDLLFTALICYQLTVCFTKVSVLAFYLRIFSSRRSKSCAWFTIACVSICGIGLLTVFALQCSPDSLAATVDGNQKCVPLFWAQLSSTIFHSIANMWLVVLALPTLSSFKTTGVGKFLLILLVILGMISILAGIMRFISLSLWIENMDESWNSPQFEIWGIVEGAVGVTCACIPTFSKQFESRGERVGSQEGSQSEITNLRVKARANRASASSAGLSSAGTRNASRDGNGHEHKSSYSYNSTAV